MMLTRLWELKNLQTSRVQPFLHFWSARPVSVHCPCMDAAVLLISLWFYFWLRPLAWAEEMAVKRVEAPLRHFGFAPLGGSDEFWKHHPLGDWVDVNPPSQNSTISPCFQVYLHCVHLSIQITLNPTLADTDLILQNQKEILILTICSYILQLGHRLTLWIIQPHPCVTFCNCPPINQPLM